MTTNQHCAILLITLTLNGASTVTNQNIKRIGFACKYIDYPEQVNGVGAKDDAKKYNTGTTTVAWLNRQHRGVAEQRLWDLMKQNIESFRLLVERVGKLEPELKMVRLSSDALPVYTEPNWRYFYQQADVVRYMEQHFAKVGEIARERDVRLSMHPGQFTVLASENQEIVDKSIEEFEYHATMARWMGYGQKFQDCKINVHISGRRGPAGIRMAYNKLSPEARNCITLENEEITWGLEHTLELADIIPTVLDLHHHWVKTGEYINVRDERIQAVVRSWRGVRPTLHFSVSREAYFVGNNRDQLPNLAQLIESGYKKTGLRAHSDFMHNLAVNDWAYTHWSWGDCMVEAKSKNLGAHALHRYWKTHETKTPIIDRSYEHSPV